jgi:hypothetical protein
MINALFLKKNNLIYDVLTDCWWRVTNNGTVLAEKQEDAIKIFSQRLLHLIGPLDPEETAWEYEVDWGTYLSSLGHAVSLIAELKSEKIVRIKTHLTSYDSDACRHYSYFYRDSWVGNYANYKPYAMAMINGTIDPSYTLGDYEDQLITSITEAARRNQLGDFPERIYRSSQSFPTRKGGLGGIKSIGIFIVTWGDPHHVLGAFDSEEKAQAAKEAWDQRDSRYWKSKALTEEIEAQITEIELNQFDNEEIEAGFIKGIEI